VLRPLNYESLYGVASFCTYELTDAFVAITSSSCSSQRKSGFICFIKLCSIGQEFCCKGAMAGYQIRRAHLIREPSYVAVGFVDDIDQKTSNSYFFKQRFSVGEEAGFKRQKEMFPSSTSRRISLVGNN
jgi:hypothetical protein